MATKEESKPQYLSLEEIAQQLNVSARTVYRWVRSGDMRAFRLGHVTRVTPEDFQKFVDKYTQAERDGNPMLIISSSRKRVTGVL